MNLLQLSARGSVPVQDKPSIKSEVNPNQKKLESAAMKFEGMFVAQLLSEMRKANEQLAGSHADNDMKPDDSLLDHAYRLVADDIATQRAFGIAKVILAQTSPKGRAVEEYGQTATLKQAMAPSAATIKQVTST